MHLSTSYLLTLVARASSSRRAHMSRRRWFNITLRQLLNKLQCAYFWLIKNVGFEHLCVLRRKSRKDEWRNRINLSLFFSTFKTEYRWFNVRFISSFSFSSSAARLINDIVSNSTTMDLIIWLNKLRISLLFCSLYYSLSEWVKTVI
jgi:hypothetical protein